MGLREKKVLARTMPKDLFVVLRLSVLPGTFHNVPSSLSYERRVVEFGSERWHELSFKFLEDGS